MTSAFRASSGRYKLTVDSCCQQENNECTCTRTPAAAVAQYAPPQCNTACCKSHTAISHIRSCCQRRCYHPVLYCTYTTIC
eukprot:3829-Heterococcus_DN1.PRE.2